jgi:large repetitive protein
MSRIAGHVLTGRRWWLAGLAIVVALLVAGRGGDGEHDAVAPALDEPAARNGTVGSSSERAPRSPALPVISHGALRLEGQAVDDGDGRPIGGARITLAGARTTTTEADGSFAFDELAEGSYALTAEQGALYGEEVDALDATTDPVTIKLRAGPTLVLHVTEPDGRPIARAIVETSSRSATTGDDGSVRLRSVDLDSEVVRISAAGHANYRDRIPSGDDPSATIERTIVLAAGAELTGLVVDGAGQPVAQAYVELMIGGRHDETAIAESDGTWKIEGLPAGSYGLRASSNVHVAAPDLPVDFDGVHPQHLVVHVAAGAQITCAVVDGGGAPVDGATVTAGTKSETTDATGHFVLAGLDPGPYDVTAATTRLGTRSQSVVLAHGATVELRLVVTPSSLAGIVVDERGAPVEDASVTAKGNDAHGFNLARTDEHGHFDLGGLPPGDYEVAVDRRDRAGPDDVVPIHASPDARNLRLVAPALGTVKGRIVLDGKAVAYYGVSIIAAGEAPSMFDHATTVRDPDGRFAMRNVGPGKRDLVVLGPGFTRLVVHLQLAPGATLELGDLAVDRGRSIHGRVVDDRGAPIAGAIVHLDGGWRSRSTSTLGALASDNFTAASDARGEYVIAGLPGDTSMRLSATHPALGASLPRELAADETEADVVIVATGAIDGTVANWGSDLFEVTAFPVAALRIIYTAQIDATGAFHFEGLPPGDYELRIQVFRSVPPALASIRPNMRVQVHFAIPATPVRLTVRATDCQYLGLSVDGASSFLQRACTDGVATFDDLAPGRYAVCRDEACVPIVVPAEPDVTIDL